MQKKETPQMTRAVKLVLLGDVAIGSIFRWLPDIGPLYKKISDNTFIALEGGNIVQKGEKLDITSERKRHEVSVEFTKRKRHRR